MHASPYHVYPASNSFYPAQTAFQNPPSGVPSVQSNNSSPQFNLKRQQIVSVSLWSQTCLISPWIGNCDFLFVLGDVTDYPFHSAHASESESQCRTQKKYARDLVLESITGNGHWGSGVENQHHVSNSARDPHSDAAEKVSQSIENWPIMST